MGLKYIVSKRLKEGAGVFEFVVSMITAILRSKCQSDDVPVSKMSTSFSWCSPVIVGSTIRIILAAEEGREWSESNGFGWLGIDCKWLRVHVLCFLKLYFGNEQKEKSQHCHKERLPSITSGAYTHHVIHNI